MDKNNIICVKCNECCKWMTFTISPESKSAMDKFTEFYKARGCKVKMGTDSLVVMVPYMCANLNLITGYCDIYNRRPQLCREYDGRWDPHMADKCQLPVEPHVGAEIELEPPEPQCPFCGALDSGDLICSRCGKLMKRPEGIDG